MTAAAPLSLASVPVTEAYQQCHEWKDHCTPYYEPAELPAE
jgi:hypothetical protein